MGEMTDIDELIAGARAARERAHAPYSDFAMGAVARSRDGSLHPGALVENVSLGLAMCAERVAMFSAVAAGAGEIDAVVVYAPPTDGQITLPCGACLQVALELGGKDVEVIAASTDGAVERHRLADLAPRLPHKRT
jgi:cytidine deaminase